MTAKLTDPVGLANLARLIAPALRRVTQKKAADVTTPTAQEASGHVPTDYRHRRAS